MSNLVIGMAYEEETVIVVPPSPHPTEITVRHIEGRNVKLLWMAPREVKILRRELLGKERAAK